MLRKKFRIYFFEKFKNKTKCFNIKKTNKLLFRRDYNYKINLIFEIKFRTQKIYELIKNQVFVRNRGHGSNIMVNRIVVVIY